MGSDCQTSTRRAGDESQEPQEHLWISDQLAPDCTVKVTTYTRDSLRRGQLS